MRLLWLVCLVVLLPLRGWAGQLMAVDMAMQQVSQAVVTHSPSAAQRADSSPPNTLSAMPADCPMHSAAPAETSDASSDIPGSACGSCDTCELCLAMASWGGATFDVLPFASGTTPPALPHGFVSADRASRLKPPIS